MRLTIDPISWTLDRMIRGLLTRLARHIAPIAYTLGYADGWADHAAAIANSDAVNGLDIYHLL